MTALATVLRYLLEAITIAILIALAVVVVAAVVARYGFNSSFIWYDEVASVMLAWLTFYGAALAALRRRHLGFPGLVVAMPERWRLATFLAGDLIVIVVFGAIGYGGWYILDVMGSDTLISLDVPLSVTQSVVPIGAALFIIATLLSAPAAWRSLAAGISSEDEEIAEEIARAGGHEADGHEPVGAGGTAVTEAPRETGAGR
ncbi:TRAP transporter small permease [Acuticoccus sp. M5D2P5]|uniref:TRAP transporter small permease n=1 Tax=Acuticoccus kalidii TaxID=2910977 RepID=UPI001F426B76|nr:TRAP transporter small permease [Acuticoccus kalidii]MCF3932898.1 TRAP transporter small permease [Acuticoccus kalidii]